MLQLVQFAVWLDQEPYANFFTPFLSVLCTSDIRQNKKSMLFFSLLNIYFNHSTGDFRCYHWKQLNIFIDTVQFTRYLQLMAGLNTEFSTEMISQS